MSSSKHLKTLQVVEHLFACYLCFDLALLRTREQAIAKRHCFVKLFQELSINVDGKPCLGHPCICAISGPDQLKPATPSCK